MRAPLYAAMTDGQYVGAWIVGLLALAFVLYAFAAGLARAASKPRPTLADQMRAAGDDRWRA